MTRDVEAASNPLMNSLLRLLLRISCALIAGLLASAPARAAASQVDLELLLAIDASGSVSAAEFGLQVHGLAAAFRDSDVVAAFAAAQNGVAVGVMQWSSPGQQIMAVDWTVISDRSSAEAFARRIIAAGRVILGETAIDAALKFAMGELSRNLYEGRRRIIDLSGDGASNWGPLPGASRDRAVAQGITINGLAIVNEQPDLGRYYRDHVIGGAGAFAMTARDYEDFARAMRLKLIEEIAARPAASILLEHRRKTANRSPSRPRREAPTPLTPEESGRKIAARPWGAMINHTHLGEESVP